MDQLSASCGLWRIIRRVFHQHGNCCGSFKETNHCGIRKAKSGLPGTGTTDWATPVESERHGGGKAVHWQFVRTRRLRILDWPCESGRRYAEVSTAGDCAKRFNLKNLRIPADAHPKMRFFGATRTFDFAMKEDKQSKLCRNFRCAA